MRRKWPVGYFANPPRTSGLPHFFISSLLTGGLIFLATEPGLATRKKLKTSPPPQEMPVEDPAMAQPTPAPEPPSPGVGATSSASDSVGSSGSASPGDTIKLTPAGPDEEPVDPSKESAESEAPPQSTAPETTWSQEPTADPGSQQELGRPQEPPYTQNEDDIALPEQINPNSNANSAESPPSPPSKPEISQSEKSERPANPKQAKESKINGLDPEGIRRRHSNDGLMRVTKKGEFIYKVESSPQSHAMSLRLGMFSPPNLYNSTTNLSFTTVYGTSNRPILFFDYEWQLFQSLGKLGLKLGTGLFTTSGNGYFKNTLGAGNTRAEEVYSFFLFPNSLSAVYRAQFFDKQFLVPYAEAGGDYFAFAEIRDDGAAPKYGGAMGFHLAFGGSILLDLFDKESLFALDKDYDVNHIWLTGEYRIIQTPTSRFDFTANVINGGILVEY